VAIDCRAKVTATFGGQNLGAVVSGSVNDDYIQGNGVVKTRGTLVIDALSVPAAGTPVAIYYTRGTVTKRIQRSLRVISSFADTFSGLTTIELGCTLTYQQELKPLPDANGVPGRTTGAQLYCLNGWTGPYTRDDYGYIHIPLDCNLALYYCCSKIGVAPSGSVQMVFTQAELDLTVGYVQLINDLLLSASCFGYVDHNEVLKIRSINGSAGSGPVLTNQNIISVSPIGVGTPPASLVLVEYSGYLLNNINEAKSRDYEKEETVSTRAEIVYLKSLTATYYPKTVTERWYGPSSNFDKDTCIIYSSSPATPDLSDAVIRQLVTNTTILAKANGNYVEQLYSAGLSVLPNNPIISYQETIYDYVVDVQNQQPYAKTVTVEEREPMAAFAARFSLTYVFTDGAGTSAVVLSAFNPVITSRVVTTTEVFYDFSVSPKASTPVGQRYVPPMLGQKETVMTYTNWGLSQAGQQAIAESALSFEDAQSLASWLTNLGTSLVLDKVETRYKTSRELYGQFRPILQYDAQSAPAGKVTRMESLYGGSFAGAARSITFKPPFTSSTYYTRVGTSLPPKYQYTRGNGAQEAKAFGRAQNRLLFGNRYGMNIQLDPDFLPAQPFDPLHVGDRGYMVQYRTNGTCFAFSGDGIMASTDALFWGSVGSVLSNPNARFFPVPPGTNTLPAIPATSTDPTYGTVVNPSAVVPGYSEVTYERIGPGIAIRVEQVPYALTAPDITVRTGVRTKVTSPPFYKLTADNGVYTRTGNANGFLSGYSVIGSAGTYTRTGRAAELSVQILEPPFSSVELLLPLDGSTSSTIFDASDNANTISSSGATLSSTGGPFGNGCAVFNGTSAGLTMTPSAQYVIGTTGSTINDYTLEVWFYLTAFPAAGVTAPIFDSGQYISQLFMFGARLYFGIGLYASEDLQLNTWYFVSVVHSSGNFKVHVNGAVTMDYNGSGLPATSQQMSIGHNSGSTTPGITGRISNFRYTVGYARNGAIVPTANFFFPPPDPYFANVKLLLPLNGTITDRSSLNATVATTSSVSASATGGPFADTGCAILNGTNNGSTAPISLPANQAYVIGTQAFTIETWIYITAYPQSEGYIFDNYNFMSTLFITSGGQLIVGTIQGPVISLNTWTHIGYGCSQENAVLYVQGIQQDSQYAYWDITGSDIAIGQALYYSTGRLKARLSNFRLTIGHRRDLSVLPTAPYPTS